MQLGWVFKFNLLRHRSYRNRPPPISHTCQVQLICYCSYPNPQTETVSCAVNMHVRYPKSHSSKLQVQRQHLEGFPGFSTVSSSLDSSRTELNASSSRSERRYRGQHAVMRSLATGSRSRTWRCLEYLPRSMAFLAAWSWKQECQSMCSLFIIFQPQPLTVGVQAAGLRKPDFLKSLHRRYSIF